MYSKRDLCKASGLPRALALSTCRGRSGEKSMCIIAHQNSSNLQLVGLTVMYALIQGLPRCLSGKESVCSAGDEFDPWVRKIPLRRKWEVIPVFLPEKSHGQRSLADYILWGHRRVRHDLETKQHTYFISLKT